MQVTISTAYGISCAILAFVWAATHRRDKRTAPLIYGILGVTFVYAIGFPAMLGFEDRIAPTKYDALLYQLDACLGISVEAYLRILPHSLSVVLTAIYQGLLWMITLWAWIQLTKPWGNFRALVTAMITGYATAGFLYLIVPACGPAYFPASVLLSGSIKPELLHGYPNAMPSMHVASAFMLMLFAGPSRWLRVTSILFLIGTAFGTVLGEHYFVDWAGAIAFACFAASVGLREKRRAAIYFAATLAWLFLIRFAGPVMIEYPVIL